MSMVFKFRMLSDENDAFIRDYEVMYDMNLLEFNDFICSDLNYDSSNMTSFFTSNERWEKVREFTLIDMEHDSVSDTAPTAMESVTLGQIIHNKHDRLIFLFDMFADRAYFLELTEAKQAESSVEYPRVALSEGEPADQYDAGATSPEMSIFDEAMGDFNDFDGDDNYDDEYV